MKSHAEAVNDWLATVDWLSNDDPIIIGLKIVAQELDANWRTTAYAEYLKTIRYIRNLGNAEGEEEQDDLLSPNR